MREKKKKRDQSINEIEDKTIVVIMIIITIDQRKQVLTITIRGAYCQK